MTTAAEITYSIQNDRPSIMIRVSAQGEGNSTPDLCGMLCQIQTAITEFQKKPPAKLLSNTEVVVQDVPQPTPATQSQQTNPSSINKENGFSQKSAQQQNDNPEKDFCTAHGVARIADLSLNQARTLIMDEDY